MRLATYQVEPDMSKPERLGRPPASLEFAQKAW